MSKVSVIGAGAVGTATAYALLIKEVARDVVLYDIATEKAKFLASADAIKASLTALGY